MAATKHAGTRRMSQFFLDGSGIDRQIIVTDIAVYLGMDALVKPGSYNHNGTGKATQGYYITAYQALNTSQIEQLKRDSSGWKEHIERIRRQSANASDLSFYPGTLKFNTVPPQDSPSTSVPYEEESLSKDFTRYKFASFPDSQPPLLRSQSVPAPSTGANIRDVKLIRPVDGGSCNAAALLDTGCLTGNWISSDLAVRLGLLERDFMNSGPPVTSQAANGGTIQSKGSIKLDWRWSLKGVKINTATFHVADAKHYDIIIGNEYIEQKQLLSWNPNSFNPLTEHDPVISPYESEDMRQARLKQEQEKAYMKAMRESRQAEVARRDHRRR